MIYKTEVEKFEAVADEIRDMVKAGRPTLVGTASVEKSELCHQMLTRLGIPHNVLNAKHHASEADIVAQAGRPGAVTISTNMAGRGTDILLGGNPEAMAKIEVGDWNAETEPREEYDARLEAAVVEHTGLCDLAKQNVLEAGGLHVIGTERHESRRIDNQLRGRAGRQGDPGSSRFYLSLEDDLMRIFGSDKMKGLMERLGMEDGVPLEHPWLSKAVGNAQQKVEGRNFGIRKNLLEYDDVLSQQRDAVYGMRMAVIQGDDTRPMIEDLITDLVTELCRIHLPLKAGPADLDVDGLNKALAEHFQNDFDITIEQVHEVDPIEVADGIIERITVWYAAKEELIGDENLRYRERYFLLSVLDFLWKKHLQAMDHLRGGIGLRSYGQRNPLLEYKKEGFEMFEYLRDLREQQVIQKLFENLSKERALTEEEKIALLEQQRAEEAARARAATERANLLGDGGTGGRGPGRKPVTVRRETAKVGRNAPCPCGSGKKYKKCHMLQDQSGGAAAAAP